MLEKVLAGHYRIVKHLGGGGFGRTFLAEDLHLPGKPLCIIKQLKPMSVMADVLELARELFDREAKVLYRLGKHDQIPSLLAHFEEDEEFFLAQEYIQGHTLHKEIQRGHCQSESYVRQLLEEILPVLEFVHNQQVIHRDIKPSNLIRRQQDGKIVLIDFGAVREVTTQSLQETSFTKPGLAVGSPGYMPSEQSSGRAQYASDIYAVGMVCIQALTGIAPRDLPVDEHTGEVKWQNLVQISAPFMEVLTKMVRFDYRQRYRTVSEVYADLAKLPLPTPPSLPTIIYAQDEPPAHEHTDPIATLPIEEICAKFAQFPDQLRLKKLMCLMCTGILENDVDRLQDLDHRDLLLSIYEICPDPDQLKTQVLNAVQTITPAKQNQYLTIGKAIYAILLPLYGVDSPQAQAANALEKDLQQLRVKKLLIYVCRNIWENDLTKIQGYRIADLLKELRQIAPTLPQLRLLLEERVQATNKPEEYQLIAELIVEKLSLSYNQPAEAPMPSHPSSPNPQAIPKNLIDLRLELMRYCNPLRLKVLLMVALSENQGSLDWTELKVHDLDELLRSLITTYSSLADLEARLHSIRNHLQPRDSYQQTILQLLRVLSPIYNPPKK